MFQKLCFDAFSFEFQAKDSDADKPPKTSGNTAPKGGEEAVAPVDDGDMAVVVDGTDNIAGNLFWLQHHGIVEITAQQIGIHEAGTDIGEVNL